MRYRMGHAWRDEMDGTLLSSRIDMARVILEFFRIQSSLAKERPALSRSASAQ